MNKKPVLILIVFLLQKIISMEAQDRAFATLGGGCFWCTEAMYTQLNGVEKAVPGFCGGELKNPTYKEVYTGTTGHAEVVHITYNPNIIGFDELLQVFFATHDPTTLNRQGEDVGTQYRSVIFYHNEEQKKIALSVIDELNRQKVFENPIVTEITAFDVFYEAENYHHDYFANNPNQPYCSMVVNPKVEKFKKLFKDKLKAK